MAKYLPSGWRMSLVGARKFCEMQVRIEQLVKKRVRKYTLNSIDPDDLMQEGRLAAAYAVDTHSIERGNIDGYISTVVSNALAMIAAEALAQCRQPYKQVVEDGISRKVPIHNVELEHETAFDEALDEAYAVREAAERSAARSRKLWSLIEQMNLPEDARAIFELRLHAPPELLVLARNLNRGRHRVDGNSICVYLGWVRIDNSGTSQFDKARYLKAARQLREQFHYGVGIDDRTYQRVPATVSKHAMLEMAI